MDIELSDEQRAFVRHAVETGRVSRAEEAVKQALDLWVERERQREELLAAIDEAEASVTSGNVRTIEKGAAQKLADEIHKRGMARMKAKKAKAS